MKIVNLSLSSKLKRIIYFVSLTVSVFTLIFLLTNPMARKTVVSPLISTFDTLTGNKNLDGEYDKFAFIPGWASGKFEIISFDNIKTLAFYDLAVNADGTIAYDTAGYENFRSYEAQDLFQRAHNNSIHVLAVLSMSSTPDIEQFLNDGIAQQALIDSAILEVEEVGIDGVVISIEYTGPNGITNQLAYSNFVKNLTEQMHQRRFGSQVAVAVSPGLASSLFYNLQSLSEHSDNIFVMTYENAVGELSGDEKKAPLYGYEENQYWKDIDDTHTTFLAKLPSHKIMTETAWYGNGDNYPFYQKKVSNSNEATQDLKVGNTLKTPLSRRTMEQLLLEVPKQSRPSAREYLPLIAKALEDEDILTPHVLAYALATIEHETASTFEPLEEFKGRKSARRLGYEGGTNYFGRGFIQLTHLRNYKKMGERVGMGNALVRNPELAATPIVAAKVLAAFFKDNGPALLAEQGDFIAARKPINPDYQGYSIALLAQKYLYWIA